MCSSHVKQCVIPEGYPPPPPSSGQGVEAEENVEYKQEI